MTRSSRLPCAALAVALLVVSAGASQAPQTATPPPPQTQTPIRPQGDEQGFRFRSGIELINVTATVTDENGRFVPGLSKDDFTVYEDGQPQDITHFSAERVPVSLGIALDTSGSMRGEKIRAAQSALNRFLYDLLDKDDEIFLYRFSNDPVLLQGWTSDRSLLTRALGNITPNGGTAMYDTIAEAIPLAQAGKHRKKALLVISDGNDTSSSIEVRDLKQRIRESEVLVYAIGIDAEGRPTISQPQPRRPRPPIGFPMPPGRGWPPQPPRGPGGGTGGRYSGGDDERVNAAALRELTDDSGGRTEIIAVPSDLNPATAGIADELSKQYYLGYPATGKKDGRWHSIRVEVRNHAYHVRARRGYVAS